MVIHCGACTFNRRAMLAVLRCRRGSDHQLRSDDRHGLGTRGLGALQLLEVGGRRGLPGASESITSHLSLRDRRLAAGRGSRVEELALADGTAGEWATGSPGFIEISNRPPVDIVGCGPGPDARPVPVRRSLGCYRAWPTVGTVVLRGRLRSLKWVATWFAGHSDRLAVPLSLGDHQDLVAWRGRRGLPSSL
jgi:hypothetical protein